MAALSLRIHSLRELQYIQNLAEKNEQEVLMQSLNDLVIVNAKSVVGVFALDFSEPVKVVTESEGLLDQLREKFSSEV